MSHRTCLVFAMGWVLVSHMENRPVYGQNSGYGRFGVDVLRRMATNVVDPEFPKDALERRQRGPVVAELRLGRTGRIEDVAILEAPCSSIGDAVTLALKQWVFSTAHFPSGMTGKVVYYFVIQNGKPLVLNAQQAPVLTTGQAGRGREGQ